MSAPYEAAVQREMNELAAKIARLEAVNAKMLESLKEITGLFQTALLCTNVEVAKEGMAFVRKARAAIAAAEAPS